MGNRPIDVGLIITTVEDRERDWILNWQEIRELVTTAEAVGFDSVWIPDHLIHEPEGVDPYGIWEAWSLISALAAVTERVQIRCAALGATSITVSAAYSAFLMRAGIKRIQATLIRPTLMGGGLSNVTSISGHAIVGFTNRP